MWKIIVGFVIFAGLGMFVIFKGGDKVDMGGEKHDIDTHTAAPAAAPVTPASAATSAAK